MAAVAALPESCNTGGSEGRQAGKGHGARLPKGRDTEPAARAVARAVGPVLSRPGPGRRSHQQITFKFAVQHFLCRGRPEMQSWQSGVMTPALPWLRPRHPCREQSLDSGDVSLAGAGN